MKNNETSFERRSKAALRAFLLLVLLTLGPLAVAAQSFNYANFSTVGGLNLTGSAAQSGSVLRLTSSAGGEQGAAFYNTQVPVGAFSTSFQFQISNLTGGGADGFSFSVRNGGAALEPGALGESGTNEGLAVQFDTFQNAGEPNANFIRLRLNGTTIGENSTFATNLSDGAAHTVKLNVSASGQAVLLLDGAIVITATGVNLSGLSPAYAGFGARTGGSAETHDILNWSFTGGTALYTVTKTADTNDGVCDADCSLREAVAAAGAGDTVQFASPLFDSAQTISISGQITIDKSLTVNGRGADLTTIKNVAPAGPTNRVLRITTGTVNLSGLTITGGNLIPGVAAGVCSVTLSCGGGIHSSGNLTLTSCVVAGNAVVSTDVIEGGGIFSGNGTLTLVGTTVQNNTVNGSIAFGGGIYIDNNGATIVNSTISGNSAVATTLARGGGINLNGGTLNMTNSTVAENVINLGVCGGVCKPAGTFNAVNTIISGNSAPSNPDLGGSLSAASTNNLIGGNVRLLPLGNYGGPLPTHALLPDSPAINAGNSCVLTQTCAAANPPVPLTADQRGRGRIGAVDIGAVEAPDNLVVTNTLDAGAGSLRAAVLTANSTPADESISFDIPATDPNCAGGVCTIALTTGELAFANNGTLIVSGPGADALRVSGSNTSRVFSNSSGANAVIAGLTVRDGNAFSTGRSGCGGGILNENSTLLVLAAVVSNNKTNAQGNCFAAGGGLYQNSGGTLTIRDSTVAFNQATANGGGIAGPAGVVNIVNTTIYGNNGGNFGGGVVNFGNPINIINSTIVNNTAFFFGGGIFVNNGSGITATNSVIANSGGGDCGVAGSSTVVIVNTLVADGSCGVTSGVNGNRTGPALVGPLGFYGGPTPTVPLLSGSPAINAASATAAPLFDQRGAGRVGAPDMGAFEVNNSANGGNYRAVLPSGVKNTPYAYTLVPSNGAFSASLTGGALPPGVNLTTAFAPQAVVSVAGTPTQAGTFNFTVTTTSGANSVATDYQLFVNIPTAAGVSVSGRVLAGKSGLRNAIVTLTDSNGNVRTAKTGTFGYYRFDDVAAGQTVVVTVVSKRFQFTPQVVDLTDSLADLDFNASPE
ncbi:MAG: CSLREA domain-containing protein [Acidobacteria bacterium]|nr:CSLREA domain-containing protein [Acidobacteriota bacterium]